MRSQGIKNGFFFCLLLICIASLSHAIVYVDWSASGAGDGTSWANAYNTIQAGVNDADSATTDIWVADGIYTETINITSSRQIYGGFEGNGGAEETLREERNWENNVTIINGGGSNVHVVSIMSVSQTRLDGFSIIGGYMNNSSFPLDLGAGISCYNINNSNIIDNCAIYDNTTIGYGAGIGLLNAHPVINHCVIKGNYAMASGGGMALWESSPQIINTVFCGNTAISSGGAIFCNDGSYPHIINCTMSSNTPYGVVAQDNSDPVIRNTIFEQNNPVSVREVDATSDISLIHCLFYNNSSGAFQDNDNSLTYQDGEMNLLNADVPEAVGNITGDPIFVDKSNCDLHIQPCSAALDQGTSDTAPTDDLDWNPRPVDFPGKGRDGAGKGYDIGAYEVLISDPQIDVNPANIDFGQQEVNQGASSPQSIEVSNLGSTPLIFNSFNFSPDFSLAPNQETSPLGICMTRTIDIVFDPSNIGAITGALDIITNDPNNITTTITLEGEGVNSAPVAKKCDENYILDFAQTSDRVIIPNAQNFPTTEFTVSCWLNTSNYRDAGIFSYAVGTAGQDNELLFVFYNQYYLRIYMRYSYINTGISFKDGLWHHLAVTWRSSDGRIIVYKDGQDVYSTTFRTGSTLTGNGTIVFAEDQDSLGGGFQSSQAYIGLLDEMRLWNRVRSKEEIQFDMYRRLNGDETGLVGYWKFDEGSGSTAHDSTVSGNDGTLSGLPDWVPDASPIYIDYTIDENTDTTITLCGEDPDDDFLYSWITQIPEPGTGSLYQFAGVGPVRGALIDTTPTLVTDPGMRVIFAPVDTPFNYNAFMEWKVNDGFVDSPNEASYTIHVLDNDAPELVANGPFSLAKGDTLYFTSPTLYATDFEDMPENIVYTLANPPTHGSLWLDVVELGMSDT
ncbi:choice-of-anchor D domain-containing protein, partial [Candidatus Sumerlaeota bacterium]|nr:choice-of-anchor D domain-containing protein [Candidatus Sumerlaeota bacterium]